jgi:hypothetical protein
MKRILKIGSALFISFLIPASILNAQEKKNEQRIKIVVADKSGTHVEIDTLIKDSSLADSINLKNGEVIYLSRHSAVGTIKHMESDNGQMVVTVTGDNKSDKNTGKKVIVISGDSTHVLEGGDEHSVVMVRGGKHITEGKGGDFVVWSSSEGDSDSEKTIYVTSGKGSKKESEKTIDVKVISDEKGKTVEKTKYVLAKDGMVVTIEGNDDAKVKDLVKDVETKLGVNNENKETKKIMKEETKKTTKK